MATKIPDKTTEEKVDDLLEKFDNLKEKDKMDLSADEDLSIAVMNLVSIEEHLFFSGAKTGNSEYYSLLKEVRSLRTELMKKIIKDYEGEVWCISKHLLAASYRLYEYGTKQLAQGDQKGAEDVFEKAYGTYSLFWYLNLNSKNKTDAK